MWSLIGTYAKMSANLMGSNDISFKFILFQLIPSMFIMTKMDY